MTDYLPRLCDDIIDNCLNAGVALDDGNVIDLLADNLPNIPLGRLRIALSKGRHKGQFPKAEPQRL